MNNPITRRLTVAAGAASFLFPRGARAADAALEAAARKEGEVTWYTAQIAGEKAERMGKAFTETYGGIKVSVIRTTGQVAYQRLMLDIKNKTPQCDVFSTTDISHMPELRDRKQLEAYTPPNAAAMMPQFQALSDEGLYYVTNASRYFLFYNTDRVKAEEAPKRWTDLLDPRWKGRVALGHPAFSGCTGVWALSLKKLYGWDFFEQLARNKPRIGRSAVDPVTLISAGECLVGPASANTAYPVIDKGNPVNVVHPSDGLVLCVTPSAIPVGAPHPNAARLFMNWLLSEQYSRLLAIDGTEPTRQGVPTKPGVPLLSTQQVIPLTVDEIRKGVPEVIEQWRETFGS